MASLADKFVRRLAIGSIAALAWLTPLTAHGKTPQVQFDFPHAIECRNVTSPESARLYPHEKTVEVPFRVSVRIAEGREKDLVELVVEIRSHSERMRVATFLPGTTLESESVGEIEIKETHESIDTRGLSVGAALPIPHGDATIQGSPAANIGRTQRKTRTATTKRIPPSHVVVASGTIHNEHGVFFRLRPSRDSAFEDVHEFAVRFVVPQQWRGDWVQLTCVAKPTKKAVSFARAKLGGASVNLGLHLAGDLEAKQAAHRLAHAQTRFLESNRQSLGRWPASTISLLVKDSRTTVSDFLATIGLEQPADWILPPVSSGRTGSGDSLMIELQRARDAMDLLGQGGRQGRGR